MKNNYNLISENQAHGSNSSEFSRSMGGHLAFEIVTSLILRGLNYVNNYDK